VANWAQDGEVLLDDDELFKFFVRSLLQANVYFIRQLPLRLHARVAPDDFLRAFTKAKDTDREENIPKDINERVDAGSWAFAPTGYTRYPDAPEDDPTMTEADKRSKDARDDGVVEWTSVQKSARSICQQNLTAHWTNN
jgi:hypothetical protein